MISSLFNFIDNNAQLANFFLSTWNKILLPVLNDGTTPRFRPEVFDYQQAKIEVLCDFQLIWIIKGFNLCFGPISSHFGYVHFWSNNFQYFQVLLWRTWWVCKCQIKSSLLQKDGSTHFGYFRWVTNSRNRKLMEIDF